MGDLGGIEASRQDFAIAEDFDAAGLEVADDLAASDITGSTTHKGSGDAALAKKEGHALGVEDAGAEVDYVGDRVLADADDVLEDLHAPRRIVGADLEGVVDLVDVLLGDVLDVFNLRSHEQRCGLDLGPLGAR